MNPNLFCYSETRSDPHAVKLRVSDEDRAKFNALPQESSEFVVVKDLDTGKSWRVRREDCGLGCRCAAMALPLLTVHQFRKEMKACWPHITVKVKTVSFADLARAEAKFVNFSGDRKGDLGHINALAKQAGLLPDSNIRYFP